MLELFKRLWLIVLLIILTSSILLISDMKQRVSSEKSTTPKIAIMQISSTPVLDAAVEGAIDRLKSNQLCANDMKNIHLFNAQGDFATANAIAKEITNGDYDLVITFSTLALQVFSKANLTTQKTHVFGTVTDPYGAGVGIKGPNPEDHPPYMTGIGTFQPVKRAFKIAKEFNPKIKKIGVVWNPGEQCSEACTMLAREVCTELGITLVEANAGNTSEVPEALRSVLSKGVDALWIGGDTVASASTQLIINLCMQNKIPVFTHDPSDTEKGTLFGLGANYYTVGQYTADMAIEVIKGKNPSEFRIENVIPEKFTVNEEVLKKLAGNWAKNTFIEELIKEDAVKNPPKGINSDKKLNIKIVLYNDTQSSEESQEGFLKGLKNAGLTEGKHYQIKAYNAQSDLSTLSSIMNTINDEKPDLVFVVSTPALQASIRLLDKSIPIVFTAVGDAVKAGAGKSESDHLPNITGITTQSPFSGMARLIKETLPNTKKVGTLFTPSEINSVLYNDWFKSALKKEGIELISVPVTASSDIPQASAELVLKDIDLLCQILDNTTRPAFPLIAKKAKDKKIPIYVFDNNFMKEGGILCLSRDYIDAGTEAAEKALRILLKNESPKNIPFSNTQSEKFVINYDLAKTYGVKISASIKAQAKAYQISKD